MASTVVFMISDALLGFMAAVALAAGLPSVGAGSMHDSTSFTRTRRVAAETDAPMRTDAWCTAPTMLDRRPCVATVRGAMRAGEPPIARVNDDPPNLCLTVTRSCVLRRVSIWKRDPIATAQRE